MSPLVRNLVGSFAAAAVAMGENMNGRYSIANGGRQGIPFNDDYASKGHEFFDMYTPEIATHYGEVFWTDMGSQTLPPEIVERFKGKVIAITGYEHDHVMVSPVGQPGAHPEKDVSVPFNWVYNHHYMFWVTGEHSELKKVHAASGDPMAHGAHTKWIGVDRPSAKLRKDTSIPTSSWFSEGNGGESRKSYHGYPKGYAQLVDSPNSWQYKPMNIDTRNRDCGVRPEDVLNCTTFVPGAEPKQARYGRAAPKDTVYSGLLECPCTERFGGDPIFYPGARTKLITTSYGLRESGTCADAGTDVGNASDCFAAAAAVGINATSFTNKTVSDPDLPPACSVVVQKDGSATVYFNMQGKAACASGDKKVGQATSTVGVTLGLEVDSSGAFERSAKGAYCSNNRVDLIKRFNPKPGVDALARAYDSRNRCEEYCLSDDACWGCSVDCQGGTAYGSGIGGVDCAWNAVSSCGTQMKWEGLAGGDITKKKPDGGLATITVSGPADVWFGIGLNATMMADMPYALIVNASGVIEQRIGTCTDEGKHCPGDQLQRSVTVLSNTVRNNVRTVVMTRALLGLTKEHYSFLPAADTIRCITAVGKSPVFGYHDRHGPAEISLTVVGTPSCVCDLGASGKLCETGGSKCQEFTRGCVKPGPLSAQRNPTCSSMTYAGGLNCCGHRRILLDTAQADESLKREVLRYHVKIRFWYQEYRHDLAGQPSHVDLTRFYYQTEAWAGEYDVPPAFRLPDTPAIVGYPDWPVGKPTPGTTCTGTCPDGPDCDCVHTIALAWNVSNIRILYAGGHCHAPSCVSLSLYINDTATGNLTLLCDQIPVHGKGHFPADKFDEKGYIHIPPCLWSDDPSEGLDRSVWLPKDTQLVSIARKRNTHVGHFGEMASWQMRGVNFPAPSQPTTFV